MKIQGYFRRLLGPTKIALFSSVADEKDPIFVEFISSAYFRREADENGYFRRHWAYFRRLLADENVLFSCSVWTLEHNITLNQLLCLLLPLVYFPNVPTSWSYGAYHFSKSSENLWRY
jgi:hypothetical protein